MTDWETAPAVAETPEIKLFGKWSTDDVQINDISLQVYGPPLYLYFSNLLPFVQCLWARLESHPDTFPIVLVC